MQVNIVVFPIGSGGNFLCRALTLDPATVPMGSLPLDSDVKQRLKAYSYDNIPSKQYNSFLNNGYSEWVDYELNHMYFPLTRGIPELEQSNKILVEFMHPDQLATKIQLFGPSDKINFSVVDIVGCRNWVVDHRLHKGAYTDAQSVKKQTEQEYSATKLLIKKYNANTISLRKILYNEKSFINEYKKICDNLQLKCYPELAGLLYKTWKNTWPSLF